MKPTSIYNNILDLERTEMVTYEANILYSMPKVYVRNLTSNGLRIEKFT